MPKRGRHLYGSPKVLVVGTTSDYIDWIRRSCPDHALFLTDPVIRQQAKEPKPAPHEEVLCDLTDYDHATQTLKKHLQDQRFSLVGITSYDCESMELAAVLARCFSLDYPSVEAIGNCRDKYLSKVRWQQYGIRCPRGRLVSSPEEAVRFFNQIDGPCILKPITGSGSELLIRCETAHECERGYHFIFDGLIQRRTNRLYRSFSADNPSILVEELVPGEEFSCDFIIEKDRVEVIRLTRKIPDKEGLFGTIRGYILPASIPVGIEPAGFCKTLQQSAAALGISRAICMLDFMVRENETVLLELAPRPGGDCLPFLLRRRYNLDILKLNLDFAARRPIHLPKPDPNHPVIGLRVHAKKGGILKKIDVTSLRLDPRVLEIHLPRAPGHLVRIPPEDYDSWVLGHIIFRPAREKDLETQCAEIIKQVIVETG